MRLPRQERKLFIYLPTMYSTDALIDLTTRADKVNPVSQYGTTKRQGETALIALVLIA